VTDNSATLEATFETHRERLLGLAYRMLGSRSDAEDIVQETWLRVSSSTSSSTSTPQIDNLQAYLLTVATRLCLDQLKSAGRKREQYIGTWLPEPVISAETPSPAEETELADDLSFALLLTLEKLTPPERAAFLLHDVFALPFKDVASSLGKSEAACRKLATRARRAVQKSKPQQSVPAETHRTLLSQFSRATETGDLEGLKRLLHDEAVLYSDGGGVKPAALNPVYGADKIARFFLGVAGKVEPDSVSVAARNINSQPGLLVYVDGELDLTVGIDCYDNRIVAIYLVRNPEKLQMVGQ